MTTDKTKSKKAQQEGKTDFSYSKLTNPIGTSKIMPLNSASSSNKLYSGYSRQYIKPQDINYVDIINSINSAFEVRHDFVELFNSIHSHIFKKFNLNFSALGIFNKDSNYISIKLIDSNNSSYNSKIMLNDSDNLVVQAFTGKKILYTTDSSYLKLNYLATSSTVIIPLIADDECCGVFIFSDNNQNQFVEFYKLIANYYAIFYKNIILSELVGNNNDTDALTGLSNHKKLQEDLANEIEKCANTDSKFAFCIFDIANISEINQELGHARGDSIIKKVANKIKINTRNTDILGRYGGDEIAVIMPNTNIEEAKYICEFLLYNLSCVMFDDLGQLKFSCGIAMYPDSTNKQEQLTLLAQQALYIAKSKRVQSGQSEIVSTSDYNFWDDEALRCFAHVLTKKHAALGINIEEELLSQFHSENIASSEHLIDVVSSLAAAIDAKDTYTKGHSAAVARYSEALARAINLPQNEVERIKLGATLHDIGKIGIPEQILRKPTKLSEEEWEIMKQHPSIGADKVLKPNKALHDLIPMVKYHHEHLDGTGYPFGLKGDEIPLSARIVSIADAYHALISDRPYRKGLTVKKACEILKMGAGVQWDKDLVRAFIIIAPSLATNI